MGVSGPCPVDKDRYRSKLFQSRAATPRYLVSWSYRIPNAPFLAAVTGLVFSKSLVDYENPPRQISKCVLLHCSSRYSVCGFHQILYDAEAEKQTRNCMLTCQQQCRLIRSGAQFKHISCVSDADGRPIMGDAS